MLKTLSRICISFVLILFSRYLTQTGAALTNTFFHFKSYRKTNIPISLTLYRPSYVTSTCNVWWVYHSRAWPRNFCRPWLRGVCGVEIIMSIKFICSPILNWTYLATAVWLLGVIADSYFSRWTELKELVIGCGLCLVNNDVTALEVGRGRCIGSRLLIYFLELPSQKVSRQKKEKKND